MYGVSLRSDLDLPLAPTREARSPREAGAFDDAPSVELLRGTEASFAGEAAAARRRAARRGDWFHCENLPDGSAYLCWTGLFEFLVSGDGRRIVCLPLNGSLESFSHYLLNQALSFSMVRLGIEPLHGTVLAIDGKAVALLGSSGYGKSTLAAALLSRGARLVTDDLMVLKRSGSGYAVYAGLPRIKLFPSMARRLVPELSGSVPMLRGTSKLIIPLPEPLIWPGECELAAVYALSPPRPRSGRIRVARLSGRQAFFETVRNTFNCVDFGGDRVARQFRFARELSRAVPFLRLSYPRKLSELPRVCDRVIAGLAELADLAERDARGSFAADAAERA